MRMPWRRPWPSTANGDGAASADGAIGSEQATDLPDVHRSLELGAFTVLSGSERHSIVLPRPSPPSRSARADSRCALRGRRRGTRRCVARWRRRPSPFAGLGWAAPNVTLIDGRGTRFTPYSTDPAELARHTIMEQPTSTYDFARSFRVALREYAPEVILLPGPGASLGEVAPS